VIATAKLISMLGFAGDARCIGPYLLHILRSASSSDSQAWDGSVLIAKRFASMLYTSDIALYGHLLRDLAMLLSGTV